MTFILPGIPKRPYGGAKIVFEYAVRLARCYGWSVCICFYCDLRGRLSRLPLPEGAKRAYKRAQLRSSPKWFDLSGIEKRCVFSLDDSSIPDGDWVFATAVKTARPIAALSGGKGRKAYLIQGFENWSLPDEAVISTYRLGMRNVAVSHWLKDLVDAHSDAGCMCIPNPVDVDVFRPVAGMLRNPHRVSVLYHEGAHKGFRFAWEAIELARGFVSDLEVDMFGAYRRPGWLPPWVRYTENATQEELADIYTGSAAYVCASLNEGFALTCLEAMACGCALVVSDFQGSREYAVDGENALVSRARDVREMAANLVCVLVDGSLRDKLGEAGLATAQERRWDSAVAQMQCVLTQSFDSHE